MTAARISIPELRQQLDEDGGNIIDGVLRLSVPYHDVAALVGAVEAADEFEGLVTQAIGHPLERKGRRGYEDQLDRAHVAMRERLARFIFGAAA